MTITRRNFLHGALALGAVPLTLTGAADATTTRSHTLHALPGKTILDEEIGKPTEIWGYQGQVPGPLLRVRQGDRLKVNFINGIHQPSTIHWHGIRIDNAMDGTAGLTQPPVRPGESFDYEFTVPDAGTFWYHAHMQSYEQVARGLYGILIVDEPGPPSVDQDLLFVIDDWRLDEQGEIHESSFGNLHDASHAGRLGQWLTTNGKGYETFPVVQGERLRLRVINTANARIVNLRFRDHQPVVMARDGQPVTPMLLPDSGLRIAPGQRIDLFIDMQENPGSESPILLVDRQGELELARFVYHHDIRIQRHKPLTFPDSLSANPLHTQLDIDRALKVELLMEGGAMGRMREANFQGETMGIRELVKHGKAWALNGVSGMPAKPLFRAPRGQTVRLSFVNDNRWPHAMHIHGHHFTVTHRNGKEQPDAVWLDTVLIDPSERVTVAFVADNPGKWLLHCHMLEHQAAGMVTWMEVV